MPSIPQLTVGAAVVSLIDRDVDRKILIVENNSVAAQVIYIDTVSDVSAVKGVRIVAGGNLVMEHSLGYPVTMPWWVIASAANALVNVYEGFRDPNVPLPGPPGNGGNGNGDDGTPPPPPPMNTIAGGDP